MKWKLSASESIIRDSMLCNAAMHGSYSRLYFHSGDSDGHLYLHAAKTSLRHLKERESCISSSHQNVSELLMVD